MPVAFSSISHGRIPIGFFNIETDMLLMDRYFFFSTDFCKWVIEWADTEDFNHDEKTVYAIKQREMIGNLSGAIYRYEFSGFIGEVYKLFPFPDNPSGFKQKPYGARNRQTVEKTLQPFADPLKIPIVFHPEHLTIDFGDYTFSTNVFREIIGYIEAGGMPGWLNGRPPEYVTEMMVRLTSACNRHFRISQRH